MRKRGQAALEFLMTYGWAILAAIVVIGVLWYLIGNPANLAGNRLFINEPFVQNAMAITAGNITIEFRNGVGEQVNLTTVSISNCGTNSSQITVADGALQSVIVGCSPALTAGSRFKGDLLIQYKTPGSTVTQSTTGSITGKVP